jgi:glycosyltransferase involved in cell wall biosynthesis
MRIAIIHDHLNQIGGAERVLLVFTEIFPEAPIFTLFYDEKGTKGLFKHVDIRTSFLQKLAIGGLQFRKLLPLMPLAFESFDLSEFDVVISHTSALAKGVLTRPETLHICYCLTPTRYLWLDHLTQIDRLEKNWLIGSISKFVRSWLRIWDYNAAQRPDHFVAISQAVAERIKKYYRRNASVIYPPSECRSIESTGFTDKYFLLISRFRPYKKVDLAIQAFNKLKLPLKIIGAGEEERKLKQIAKSNIEFLGSISEIKKIELLSGCQALIHPQEEDFGLTVVEAMAQGKPVIAFRAGGAQETVVENETGLFFDDQCWESLADAVIRFKPENFDSSKIKQHAEKFNKERFKREIKELVEKKWKQKTVP